jgi:acetylornithine deacetylase/succinyl-diaminopimelate desuccinylase-like protein
MAIRYSGGRGIGFVAIEEGFKIQALEELKALLRIPSVSALPEHKEDVARAASFIAGALKTAGLRNVRLAECGGHPLVLGEWLEAEGQPALLLYGHYDVQPADPLEEWKSPPFEPTVRGGSLFARGASDDKGQTWILIKAVEWLMKRDGRLPVNVRFLIEGEEESGGESVARFVQQRGAEARCDAVVICDTEMFAPGLPSICTGLRGIVYGEIRVEGARQDLHSGVYGGVAPNAVMAAAEIVTALKHRDGRIMIPDFYKRVAPPTAEERASWRSLPFDEERYREQEVGAAALTGEPGYGVLERAWARPTFEVHGIRGGFTGEGAKTVIPARAVAKVSLRLVADQRPEEAAEQLAAAVKAAAPEGVTAGFVPLHGAAPSLVDPSSPYIQKAARAMEQVFGARTAYIRSGGSIPIVGTFREHLGAPSVLMGFGLPDDNLHAPNEKFHIPNFYAGMECVVRYLESF